MQNVMVTADYDNVVVVDTQVILEAKPLEQLHWGELFEGSILLLIVRQVQTEIDKRKSDGRLGKRAREFNRLLDTFLQTRVPSSVLGNPRIDVATIAHGTINWEELDGLEKEDGDDRIVAQALNAKVDDRSRLVLLSHDIRPRDAAASFNLKALKMPDSRLREPEQSPHEKKMRELEAKVRILETDQPKLNVSFELLTNEPWLYRDVSAASDQQIYPLLRKRLAQAAEQRQPTFSIKLANSFDHSYDRRVADWKSVVQQNIPILHMGISRQFAQHRLRVTIENFGEISAENLSLEIVSGNSILHSAPYFVLLLGPHPPRPRNFPADLINNNFPELIPSRRDQFSFHWEEEGPAMSLLLSCTSFRQRKKHSVDLSIELLHTTSPKLQLEAIVTATNLKGEVRRQLLVDVSAVPTDFDELFDAKLGRLKVQPPFDALIENKLKDISLFFNSREVWEQD